MLGVDIPDGFKDTFRRPRATEFLHESRMAHQPRESREKLDVLRLASGRRQQEEENPTRLMLRRSERDRFRRDGYEQDRGIPTAPRGVRNGDAMPNRRREFQPEKHPAYYEWEGCANSQCPTHLMAPEKDIRALWLRHNSFDTHGPLNCAQPGHYCWQFPEGSAPDVNSRVIWVFLCHEPLKHTLLRSPYVESHPILNTEHWQRHRLGRY